MRAVFFCLAFAGIVACGVKIVPSPFLADQPGRFTTESDRRIQAEAAKQTPRQRPAATPTPTPTGTPAVEAEPTPIPPQ